MAKKNKAVRISCTAAGTVEIEKLTIFQGTLKSLSDLAYQRLRSSILDLGFSFPVMAWKLGKINYVLDATQRLTTLKKMRDEEGFTIPPLPVVWVEAANEKEAARKLLAAASQYGEVTPDGLFAYMERFKITSQDLGTTYQFPEIDLSSFKLTYFPETTRVTFEARKEWEGMPEFDHEDKQAFRSVVVHFHDQAGVDAFAKLTKQKFTDKTRMMWYPEIIIEKAADKRYGAKS